MWHQAQWIHLSFIRKNLTIFVAFHKSQALHNQLTQIEDIAPIVKFLTLEGWWINGQTLFANGGYTTR